MSLENINQKDIYFEKLNIYYIVKKCKMNKIKNYCINNNYFSEKEMMFIINKNYNIKNNMYYLKNKFSKKIFKYIIIISDILYVKKKPIESYNHFKFSESAKSTDLLLLFSDESLIRNKIINKYQKYLKKN